MALPIEVSAEMVSYSYFYWKKYDCNWVTKFRSRYYCNMSRLRPRLMSCHWSSDPRWVKISGHAEQLGPSGSTSHFVNNRHSRVKTQGASCIRGFGQTDGRRKFGLGIPQSRGASYIRDKMVHVLLRALTVPILKFPEALTSLRQNGCHISEDFFKSIFWCENNFILIHFQSSLFEKEGTD